MADKLASFDFSALVSAIRQAHEYMAAQAGRAVNISLTLRNWVIGCYIREYEQNGADRATYGENLLSLLSQRLEEADVGGCASRSLRLYRQFYLTYPKIWQTASAESQHGLLPDPIWQTLSAKFAEAIPATIRKSLVSEFTAVARPTIRGSVTSELQLPPERLVNSLSFSHFAELIAIDDPLKRTFYEVECIRGNWSVRELKRQIGSLYYERSGLSMNKEKLAELVRAGADQAEPKLAIRDPYIFEFLGIKPREVMRESDLEDALLDKLQDFLMELGHGFCFEARQKRILIGDTHGFVDLVFYHRTLKCHVLVELKIEAFTHENLGQLNTYVSWYKKNIMTEGDNPPVGILLCTQKDHALVEYAIAGMDNNLFVSKYQLELPKKEEIQRFLEEKMREVSDGK
jgi:predicted nuclease of restriction endonuclease-like (RecB) superfamily